MSSLMGRKEREREEISAKCRACSRFFTYKASLPRQNICIECFYESRGDLTGSLEEKIWQAGYQAGFAKAEAIYYSEFEKHAKKEDATQRVA